MQVYRRDHSTLSGENQRTTARPHRPAYRGFRRLLTRRCAARAPARARQSERGFVNANIPPGRLREFCPLDEAGERALEMAVRRLTFSARSHDRILKVARTIADIGGAGRSRPNTSDRKSKRPKSSHLGTSD